MRFAARLRTSARSLACLGTILVLIAACAGVRLVPAERQATHAIVTGDTRLARVAFAAAAERGGESGVYPLTDGFDAFVARVTLIDAAESALDFEYYIWKEDTTGQFLLERVVAAADRGVRVRLLLDDWGNRIEGATLRVLDAHPNVEVRLFNPAARGTLPALAYLLDLGRLGRRMHNKALVADGHVAIVGGRNVGDEYFGAADDAGFADLDVMMVGPVVAEVSAQFDAYWNSPLAFAIADVVPDEAGPGSFLALRRVLAQATQGERASAYLARIGGRALPQELQSGTLDWLWGTAHAVWDDPRKLNAAPADATGHLAGHLAPFFRAARREVLVVSPYLVPGRAGVAFLASLEGRGVDVRILTNSLDTTDVLVAHAAYARHREALLEAGIELFESRPAQVSPGRHHRADLREIAASPYGALHTKVYGIDRETLFVGSFNFDPRSRLLNTEMGVVLEIPALAERLAEGFEEIVANHAWRLERVAPTATAPAAIQWVARENGREVRRQDEPGSDLGRRLGAFLLALLPIEDEL